MILWSQKLPGSSRPTGECKYLQMSGLRDNNVHGFQGQVQPVGQGVDEEVRDVD